MKQLDASPTLTTTHAVPPVPMSAPDISPAEIAAVLTTLESGCLSIGPRVEAFERAVTTLTGARHAVAVSSGTAALHLAVIAAGVQPGDLVLTTSFSFIASANCALYERAIPVFVDVDPVTLTMRAEDVARVIGPRTKAIIPVHLYGLCADMGPLLTLAAAAGLAVIEDAAQALGATCDGRQAGALGTFGCFSFFPSKNLGAFGDAGLVTTHDEALAARIKRLRNHGAEQRYYHREIGGNFRLDALQAAVLRVKLPHLPRWNAARDTNAQTYRQLFAAAGLQQVVLPADAPGRRHIYHQFVVRVPERDRVRAHLAERGVGTDVYYPVPFHRQECFAGLTPPDQRFPEADRAAEEVLALPIFPELTHAQQAHVVDAIAECLKD